MTRSHRWTTHHQSKQPSHHQILPQVLPVVKRAFIGVIHGAEYEDRSASGGETVVCFDDKSSSGETGSLYQLQDGRISGGSDGNSIPDPFEPPSRVGIFMAGAQPVQNPAAGAGNPVPSPAQVLMDLTDKMTALLTATVDPADKLSMMRRWHS